MSARQTRVKALFFDVFGTLVDWRSSVARETELILSPVGTKLDWLAFADAWRAASCRSFICTVCRTRRCAN